MKFGIIPYKFGSKSAKNLNFALRAKGHIANLYKNKMFQTPPGSRYWISWGAHVDPQMLSFLQTAYESKIANLNFQGISNKLKFFQQILSDSGTGVPYTAVSSFVQSAISNGDGIWVARTKLNRHSAEGLYLLDKNKDFIEAPLYTKYIPKKDEYRCHFMIDPDAWEWFWQKKLIKSEVLNSGDVQPDTFKVRNLQHGWVYSSNAGNVPNCVFECARKTIDTIRAKGYDKVMFGALDVIYNEKSNKAYVLEVNTAPGLCEVTADWYANRFIDAIGGL